MTGPRAIATAWMQPSSRRCRDGCNGREGAAATAPQRVTPRHVRPATASDVVI
jgi:hypothetical protein